MDARTYIRPAMKPYLQPTAASHYPEHLAPLLHWHGVSGAISGKRSGDARMDVERLLADQRTAWEWAIAKQVAVLSINADRNGAYLFVAASPMLQTLFGDECTWISRYVEHGLETSLWIGCIGHIRVFWLEVKCAH